METLTFDPLFPPAVLAGLWAAAAGFCLAYLFWRPARLQWTQRVVLAVLHFIPMAAVLILLHRPTWVICNNGDEGERPRLAIITDLSASMATEDGPGGITRHAEAMRIITKNLPLWDQEFNSSLFGFDKTVQPFSNLSLLSAASPVGSQTDIAGAVNHLLDERPRPTAALLISDGIHNGSNDLAEAARAARAATLPIYTIALGSDTNVADIGVILSATEELAFVHQHVTVPVTIIQSGFDNAEIEVVLSEGKNVIEKRKVRLGGMRTLVEFQISRDKPGLYSFEVSVPPQKNEALSSNNRRRFSLRVVDERIRILYMEGKPFWDSKFIMRLLERDPNVMLSTAIMMRADRIVLEPPAPIDKMPLPDTVIAPWTPPRDTLHPLEDRRFLSQFQVLMLGRETAPFFTDAAIENVRDWVSRSGGHLICTRGRPASGSQLSPAMSALLPVAWKPDEEKRFKLKLTERGKSMALFNIPGNAGLPPPDDPEVLLKALPSLVTASSVDKESAISVVLARAEGELAGAPMAVLSTQNYGSGKSVVLEGQGMWRWAFRPAGPTERGEDLFRAFWANLIRWLAGSNEFLPSQRVTLRAGKPLYQAGEHPFLYLAMRESEKGSTGAVEAPKIEIVREDAEGGLDHTFKPLRATMMPTPREKLSFQAELEGLDEGHYRATLLNASVLTEAPFEIMPPLQEKLDLRARPQALAQLSLVTGGKVLTEKDLSSLGKLYNDFVIHAKPGHEIKRPAWDHIWVLLLIMASLGATWWLRRHWGAI